MVRRTRRSKRLAKKFKNLVGTRAEVMHGTAYKTTYGKTKSQGGDALTKKALKYNKGRIVSRVKSGKKKQLLAQLRNAGYTYKRGSFGAVKIGSPARTAKKGRRCRHKKGKKKGRYKKCKKSRRTRRRR